MICEEGHIYHGTRCLICQAKLYAPTKEYQREKNKAYIERNRERVNYRSRLRRQLLKLFDKEAYQKLLQKRRDKYRRTGK